MDVKLDVEADDCLICKGDHPPLLDKKRKYDCTHPLLFHSECWTRFEANDSRFCPLCRKPRKVEKPSVLAGHCSVISMGYLLICSTMFLVSLLDVPKDAESYSMILSFGIGIPFVEIVHCILGLLELTGVDKSMTRSWPVFIVINTPLAFFVSLLFVCMYTETLVNYTLLYITSWLYIGRLTLLGILGFFLPCSKCVRDFFAFPSN